MNQEIETEEDEFETKPERIRLYTAARALEQAQALMQRGQDRETHAIS